MERQKQKRIGFIVQFDWEKTIAKMDDAKAGQLLKWMFAYHRGGEVAIPDDVKMLASYFSDKFDERTSEYIQRCNKNKDSANERWREKTASGAALDELRRE